MPEPETPPDFDSEPWPLLESEIIDRTYLDNGTEFMLAHRGDEWVVRVGSMILMSSLEHHSEEALAEHALSRVPEARSVLVGGLGLGFTLRAVLDRVSADTKVTVAELVPALVKWNCEHVGGLAGHPLADPRSEVIVGDVLDVLKRSPGAFDVILLDVDNGPVWLSNASNQRLYHERGVRVCLQALRPGGVLAVWSVNPNARFARALSAVGFAVEVLRVAIRKGGYARHVVFLATAPAAASP